MGSETLPSASYILSDESSIPFYLTGNGYKNKEERNTPAISMYCKVGGKQI